MSPQKVPFKAGMYLLETLTTGMYNEPLAIYREYIQNSVDSIDLVTDKNKKNLNVNIHLDPFNKQIIISDNGSGLTANAADEILCTLGSSNKRNSNLRGFRGIGRLGGIAFSDKAIFKTKAKGETVESVQEWDCQKLRKYLADPQKSKMSLIEIMREITKITKADSKNLEESYFSVTLNGVKSFRNYIFDLQKVMKYLCQISPVNFDLNAFSFGNEINEWLSSKLENYGVYNIFLNGKPVFKPYQNKIQINKTGSDKIIGINKIEIRIKDKVVAYGWYGIREELLGGIAKGEESSGIRVRVGNILIGDSHLLDGCFRETRFNSYFVGEIHVSSSELIPNSRRDDFIDNEHKTLFYNAIEKEIGLPLSKKIRLKSRAQINKETNLTNNISINKGSNCSVEQKIMRHPSIEKILQDIIALFGSMKEFNQILSDYNIH